MTDATDHALRALDEFVSQYLGPAALRHVFEHEADEPVRTAIRAIDAEHARRDAIGYAVFSVRGDSDAVGPDLIRAAARRPESIAADANRFGNEPPREIPDPTHRLRWGEHEPCTECGSTRVFRYGQPNGQQPAHDEPVECPDCHTSWDAAVWRQINGQVS